jgi:hypothetical protein
MSTKAILACLSLVATLAPARASGVPEVHCPQEAKAKIAFVFEGAAHASPAQRAAAQRVQERLGSRACVRTFDHLSSGVDPDANARFLLGTLALERYSLVFLITPRHAEAVTKVARQFPDTTYLQLGGRSFTDNLIAYRLDVSQARKLDSALSESSARVRTDWEPFYSAAAECVLHGNRLRPALWSVGLREGVIKADASAIASRAWQNAKARAGNPADLCVGRTATAAQP